MRASAESLAVMYPAGRPMVFAHRGAMADAPMNTIAAFELAAEQGADGIELDVWLCQDDEPVVLHDFEVDATTDGTGRVGSMPLAELRELDAGSWFDEKYAGERIPTLDEVFEAVGQKLYINVEIKSVSMDNKQIVYEVTERIRKHNLGDRVLVSAFNPLVLRSMRKAAGDVAVGFLRSPELAWWGPLFAIGTRYDAWHPYHTQVTAEVVKREHAAGRKVNVWTVNDDEVALKLRDAGVDGIITDRPAGILAALEASA